MGSPVIAFTESTGRVGRRVALALRRRGVELRLLGPGRRPSARWRFLGAKFISSSQPVEVQRTLLRGTRAVLVAARRASEVGGPTEAEGEFEGLFRVFDDLPGLERVVVQSSMGAHVEGRGLIDRASALESRLSWLLVSTAFVRPAMFMENWSLPFSIALRTGVLPSIVGSFDRSLPMVSIVDVADVVERALAGPFAGRDVLELEGSRRPTVREIAEELSARCRRPIRPLVMGEREVEAFLSTRFGSSALAREWRAMLRHLADGTLEFEAPVSTLRGRTSLGEVIETWKKEHAPTSSTRERWR